MNLNPCPWICPSVIYYLELGFPSPKSQKYHGSTVLHSLAKNKHTWRNSAQIVFELVVMPCQVWHPLIQILCVINSVMQWWQIIRTYTDYQKPWWSGTILIYKLLLFISYFFIVTRLHTNPPKATPPATREPSVCWAQNCRNSNLMHGNHTRLVDQPICHLRFQNVNCCNP